MSVTVNDTLLEALAVTGANAPAYVKAVFMAHREGLVVASLPRGGAMRGIPGVKILERLLFEDKSGWLEESYAVSSSDAPAQIVFSSGTTGRPKPILLSHRALGDVVARLNTIMEVDGAISEYIGVPVYYSFGFGRARAVAAAGGRAYLPEYGFNPSELAAMLRDGSINAVSAVPTLWRVVLDNADIIGDAGRKVRWLEIGSQYMSRAEKEAMKRLFPNAKIIQHYGLTEASRTTLLDISAAEGDALESVGRAVGNTEVKLSDDGEIMIRGPHLADGVVTGAGVKPLADAEGWLKTRDRGEIKDGRLYYLGRADDLINCGGIKIDPEQFERRLSEKLGASGEIAVGKKSDRQRGDLVLIVRKSSSDFNDQTLRQAAQDLGVEHGLVGAGAFAFAEATDFPRTETGKIKRGELEKAAVNAPAAALENAQPPKGDHAAQTPKTAGGTRIDELRALWEDVLGVKTVNIHESFFDLGGDSLSAVNVVLRMEQLGVDPALTRQIFEGRTIAEIAATEKTDAPASPKTAAAVVNDALNAARGLIVLALIGAHWLPFFLERLPNTETLYYYANPFLRIGTPCFAIIYGLGLGYYLFPLSRNNPERLKKSRQISLAIVGLGILVIAAFSLFFMWRQGESLTAQWPTRFFYSVLLFYFISIATWGPLFRLLCLGRHVILNCLLLAAVLFLINDIVWTRYHAAETEGIVNLIRLMLVAKYNIFLMTGIVMFGLAMGLWIRDNREREDLGAILALTGVALLVGGVSLSFATDTTQLWFTALTTSLPMNIAYAGVTALAFAAAHYFAARFHEASAGRLTLRLMAITGVLSLFLYVTHGLVPPLKDFFMTFGVSETASLAIAVALFFALWAYAVRRLYRVYYG